MTDETLWESPSVISREEFEVRRESNARSRLRFHQDTLVTEATGQGELHWVTELLSLFSKKARECTRPNLAELYRQFPGPWHRAAVELTVLILLSRGWDAQFGPVSETDRYCMWMEGEERGWR